MGFAHPLLLWLLPLAALPILLDRANSRGYSWLAMLPSDPLSSLIGLLLKILAAISLFCIILGLAGPHSLEQKIQRIGVGAQIGMVIDRSASMDDPFSEGTAEGRVGETKSVAAARLMTEFVSQRKNDMIGVVTFSNSAMYVLPLTDSREAVLAAIKATSGNSLFQTNIGGGLSSAVSLFEHVPDSGSRAIILISDGAGRVGAEVQQKLRDWLERYNLSLYWVVLRQPAGVNIFDPKYQDHYEEMLPSEVELYNYFKLLRTPFHAYQAEDPKSLAAAMADINQKEKKPIKYMQKIPGHDYTQLCYFIAAIMIGLLLSVKYFELRTWNTKP